jgi:two-component system sensor histidine kinase EvgS
MRARLLVFPGIFIALAALYTLHAYTAAPRPALAEAERAWLAAHPSIEFSYDPDWVPFSHDDPVTGRFSGLDADVLSVLADRLGVTFVPVRARDWPDAYDRALRGDVRFLTGTSLAPGREEHFLFTRPYVSFPVAIITRASGPAFDDLSLLVGQRVAAVRDYAPTLALHRDFPDIELVECANVAEALALVVSGRADAALTNLVNAAHVIRDQGLPGLKVAGVGPYVFQLRLAVRRDSPELYRALDTAIAGLDNDQRQALLAPYVRIETGDIVSWARVLRWALGLALLATLVLAALGWHQRRLRRELEARRLLQAELESSRDRLARLNEEKSGLMRMAAHDLRNPITALLLGIDLLRGADPRDQESALDRMTAQVHQMLHLVRNLLDVQALEAGTRRLHPERLVLAEVARESLATLEAAARRKAIRIDLDGIPPALAVLADRGALHQICDNLVSNAVKYSPPGTTVRLAATPSADGRTALLSVIDEGPGVRPDEMPRLFEKYTCLSARPTAGESSTGLGLSIIRELVQRLGGRVWCESPPGCGSTFFVELPAAGQSASSQV